jgi:hypothetical protein
MNAVDPSSESVKPWYRQFWFWFVFAPLIYIMCMCAVTVTIALKGADDVIIDNYYKEGRMINQTLEQDKTAQALGLSSDLNFSVESGEVRLSFKVVPEPSALLPDMLMLMMGHPVKAERDQIIMLTKVSDGNYRGELVSKPEYSWYLTLYPVSNFAARNQALWTLSGEINFSEATSALLKPRVAH